MKSQQKGFTLIELIVVIVILGILAATALPKFVDLSGDARAGVIRGVEASMRSANVMLYGKAAARNALGAGPTPISATNTINVNVDYGYAAAVADLSAVMDLSPASDFVIDTTNNVIQHNGATTKTSCQVKYEAATATTQPKYTATTSGC
ncbi:hypothetical protein AZSP09_29580 [Azospira sp. I09]|nr:hypothetical protein AZSP09_29580 [Azospira sp. I09]